VGDVFRKFLEIYNSSVFLGAQMQMANGSGIKGKLSKAFVLGIKRDLDSLFTMEGLEIFCP
jgi:hypothetical protein